MEEILLAWFKEVWAAGADGKVLREKADEIAPSLDIQGSIRWMAAPVEGMTQFVLQDSFWPRKERRCSGGFQLDVNFARADFAILATGCVQRGRSRRLHQPPAREKSRHEGRDVPRRKEKRGKSDGPFLLQRRWKRATEIDCYRKVLEAALLLMYSASSSHLQGQ